MKNKTLSGEAAQKENGFDEEDLAQIFNYPSIGELFEDSDSKKIEDFRSRLSRTSENLERVIRYGNREESERAARAVRAIRITFDFLKTLQTMRENQIK